MRRSDVSYCSLQLGELAFFFRIASFISLLSLRVHLARSLNSLSGRDSELIILSLRLKINKILLILRTVHYQVIMYYTCCMRIAYAIIAINIF